MTREMLINSTEFNSSDTPPLNFAVGAGLSKSTVMTRAIQTMTINQKAELQTKVCNIFKSNQSNVLYRTM